MEAKIAVKMIREIASRLKEVIEHAWTEQEDCEDLIANRAQYMPATLRTFKLLKM